VRGVESGQAGDRCPAAATPAFRIAARKHAAAHAFPHRRTRSGIKVAEDGKLVTPPLESYVPQLVWAVRNSAQGLIAPLTSAEADAS
jgi:hypothetical protein